MEASSRVFELSALSGHRNAASAQRDPADLSTREDGTGALFCLCGVDPCDPRLGSSWLWLGLGPMALTKSGTFSGASEFRVVRLLEAAIFASMAKFPLGETYGDPEEAGGDLSGDVSRDASPLPAREKLLRPSTAIPGQFATDLEAVAFLGG